jgi:predicted HD phosphohydrolase
MTNPFADPALPQPLPEPPSQDTLLVAALLHLMSHYTARTDGEQPCVKLASVIERHLCALARLPDADPVLRATCEQLAERWAGLVDETMPHVQRAKQPLLARFMTGQWRSKLVVAN